MAAMEVGERSRALGRNADAAGMSAGAVERQGEVIGEPAKQVGGGGVNPNLLARWLHRVVLAQAPVPSEREDGSIPATSSSDERRPMVSPQRVPR
jgi:hypothetical protein